ncbi:MAG: PKD domain-containing protein [Thermoplasmata archaeon]|nr:PKD domain-containing protein [Thermoplasmata archaeon]
MWFTEGTWDASDGYLFYYGGDNWAGTNLASAWAYTAGSWNVLSTSGNPGPLDGPALAYDPPAGAVVMYGGLASYAPFTYTNLTWTYAGGTWTSAHLSPSPPARLAGSMVYDSALGGVVLFGGYDNRNPSGGTLLNDLWLFKAGAWSQISATNPPPVRTWTPIAYDAGLGELVLYGGMNAAGQCLGDTWSFANGTWTHDTGAGSSTPGTLCANSLLFDPDVGRILLTGGFGFAGSTQVNNTASWTFNGTAWLSLPTIGSPADHAYGPSAWDPSTRTLVTAGGEPTFFETDVLSTVLTVANLSGPSTVEVGQVASFTATIAGGVPQRTVNWSWGDGTNVAGGSGASHPYTSTGSYVVRIQVRDALGHSAEANASILVTTGPLASILSSPAAGDVGIALRFHGAGSGGTGAVSVGWQFGDGSTAAGEIVQHPYLAVGTYPVTLTATDSVGGTGAIGTNVTIYPTLVVHINGTPVADAGWPVVLRGEVTGGETPYSYLWNFDQGPSASVLTPSHVFPVAGSHLVDFLATDGTGFSTGFGVHVQVAAYPSVTVTGPMTVGVGDLGSWSASVAGGQTPYAVKWSFPDGIVVNGTTATHALATAGSYALHVSATDALGATVNASVTVSVAAPAGTGGTGPLGSSAALLAVVGLAVVVAATGVALLVRHRRRALEPPSE